MVGFVVYERWLVIQPIEGLFYFSQLRW